MPAHPLEIMLGKIAPNVFVGAVQSTLVLLVAKLRLRRADDRLADAAVPGALLLFIAANLAVGYTFSTIAQNQLQAMQMTVFFLLPSILLSGFAFPFRGMPVLGAMDRRDSARHAFPAGRAWNSAQRQRFGGDLARSLAAYSLSVRGGKRGAAAIPPHARLRGRRALPIADRASQIHRSLRVRRCRTSQTRPSRDRPDTAAPTSEMWGSERTLCPACPLILQVPAGSHPCPAGAAVGAAGRAGLRAPFPRPAAPARARPAG